VKYLNKLVYLCNMDMLQFIYLDIFLLELEDQSFVEEFLVKIRSSLNYIKYTII